MIIDNALLGISSWRLAPFACVSLLLNVPAGLLLDQLLKYEYRYHPDLWEADGKPSGFLWCPKDAEWFYTATRPFAPPFKWLFLTPSWVRANPTLVKKLNLIRALHIIGTGVAIALFGYVFI